MKAKIKATGEVLRVVGVDSENVFVKYEGSVKSFRVHEVDLIPEPYLSNKEIDWEQRRYEIAKDIMSAFVLSTKQSFYCHYNNDGEIENKTPYSIAKEAVYYVDCLISVLSK